MALTHLLLSGRGNSQTNNQQDKNRIKQEEEDDDDDDEGIDQPDSLYCTESIGDSDEVDGLLEFQRKIESDV